MWISSAVLAASWAGNRYGWGDPVILGLFAVAVVGLIAFIRVELDADEPVVPVRIYRNRNFAVAAGLRFMVGFAMFGAMTFLPQFQQYVQGASATGSGLLMLPMMAGVVTMSIASGRITSRTGKYRMFPIMGSVFMVSGLALLSLITVDSGRVETGVFMFVLGMGLGCMFSSTQTIAQNSVQMSEISAATASVSFMQAIGGSLGVSLFGALYAHTLSSDTHGAFAHGVSLPPSALYSLPQNAIAELQHGITHGAALVFLAAALASVVGLAASLLIKQVELRTGGIPKQVGPTDPATAEVAHV
jgi:predicted MFS family arabinose efflux permease